MAKEIERKFLVKGDAWRGLAKGTTYRQGYLNSAEERTVRVRTAEDKAFLTIKGLTVGATRAEYEYEIPPVDAERMLCDFCNGVVEKVRHYVPVAGCTFEVDEFLGENAGLVVAEIELTAIDQVFPRPPWLGRDVTDRLRYYNLNLLEHPYSRWDVAERSGE